MAKDAYGYTMADYREDVIDSYMVTLIDEMGMRDEALAYEIAEYAVDNGVPLEIAYADAMAR